MNCTFFKVFFSLLIFAGGLYSAALGGNWERPGQDENRRVHRNNGRHLRVEVDDSTFTLAKWDSLSMPAYLQLAFSRIPHRIFEVSGDTIAVGNDNFTSRFYMTSEKDFEWEIVFKSEPDKNTWTFPMKFENLLFFYQPPLEQWEIDEGAVRPDSVVGSYAVYHSTRRDNDYRAGKAFHIYRPKAWDSATPPSVVWLDLSIDTVASTITIAGNQRWFKNAVYPITIDPTFGYRSDGASSWLVSTDYVLGFKATTGGSAGTGDSIGFWIQEDGSAATIRGSIYTDNGGACDALVDTVTESKTPATNTTAEYVMALDGANLSASTDYWLALHVATTSTRIKYDSGSFDGYRSTSDSWPADDPCKSATWTYNDKRFSSFVIYTVSGGADTPSLRRRKIRKVFGGP